MITAAIFADRGPWVQQVRALLAERVTLVDLDPTQLLNGSLGNLAVDLVVLDAQYLTEPVINVLSRLQAAQPRTVTVCLATEEAAQRARDEGLMFPDAWVIVPAQELQLRTQLEAIVSLAESHAMTAPLATPAVMLRPQLPFVGDGHPSRSESLFYRLVGRMTSSFDIEQLLARYCDAVHQLTQCVSFCLLWLDPGAREFRVVRAEGLPPVVSELCRLSVQDPLPSWMQRHRCVVTRDSAPENLEMTAALRELDLCGGVLALPLLSEGSLRGIMAVGPRALGGPYLPSEVEALFVLSANAAASARQFELHHELEARNCYIDQVLHTMESGIVTIGTDTRVRVCNPYAARVLQLNAETVVGQDLRNLPSPLGDYLYGCLVYGEERSHEELSLRGGQTTVRISTRRLLAPDGELIGSMMLLEDITAERALAEERRKVDRGEVINQIVARFAHELKNPLATINTFVQLLPTRIEDPEFRQFWTDHVSRDVHRLDDLVTKLVSLSEMPAARSPQSRQTMQVHEIIQRAIERTHALDSAAKDHVTTNLNGDLPPVCVDAEAMATAVSHLLRFGLGARYEPVVVEARLQEGPEGEQPVAILIRTQQKGVCQEDPYQLLDPSYVINHPEIDLGPSASQRLVESQGGALEVYRENDELVFRISLIPVREHHGMEA